MKLDRNINQDGKGKYELIHLRGELTDDERRAISILVNSGRIRNTSVGAPDEFFLIKLKDEFAYAALIAYADQASVHDTEYALEVYDMAYRAQAHPLSKRPD